MAEGNNLWGLFISVRERLFPTLSTAISKLLGFFIMVQKVDVGLGRPENRSALNNKKFQFLAPWIFALICNCLNKVMWKDRKSVV